ncbi:MAG: hypothetical protein ABUK01_12540 [Leptospirales bacterium]
MSETQSGNNATNAGTTEAEIVQETMKGLDNIISNTGEKTQANSLVQKQMQSYKVKIVTHMQNKGQLGGDAHKASKYIDTWLAKNIRPMTLIFILVLYAIFSFGSGISSVPDANGNKVPWLDVPGEYVKLLGNWGMVIMSFYFGGRTVEKSYRHFSEKKLQAQQNMNSPENENADG